MPYVDLAKSVNSDEDTNLLKIVEQVQHDGTHDDEEEEVIFILDGDRTAKMSQEHRLNSNSIAPLDPLRQNLKQLQDRENSFLLQIGQNQPEETQDVDEEEEVICIPYGDRTAEMSQEDRLNSNFVAALDHLRRNLKKFENSPQEAKVNKAANRLISTITVLKEKNKEPILKLIHALEATNQFIEKEITPEQYQSVAKEMQTNTSTDQMFIGSLMMVLGAVACITGILMSSTCLALLPGLPTACSGVALFASGLTLFSLGNKNNLTHRMGKVAHDLPKEIKGQDNGLYFDPLPDCC